MIEMLKGLENNGGYTFKRGKSVRFKTGYQVADYGTECKSAEEAALEIRKMGGNAGVWYSEGIYYIDHSFRVKTKTEAVRLGKLYNQQSILKWSTMELIWCDK